jgi:hypothetical protein
MEVSIDTEFSHTICSARSHKHLRLKAWEQLPPRWSSCCRGYCMKLRHR